MKKERKKQNMKKMLAVLLSASMAFAPVSTWAVSGDDAELFQDGAEAAFTDGVENPEMTEEPETAEEPEMGYEDLEAAEAGDGTQDSPVEIQLDTEVVLTKPESLGEIYANYSVTEVGTYRISAVWDNENDSSYTQKMYGDGILRMCFKNNEGTEVTVKVTKIPSITSISCDFTELKGYTECDGNRIQNYMTELNPNITVGFENGTSTTVHYRDGLPGYGSFVIKSENGTISSDELQPGEHTFKLGFDWDRDVSSQTFTYNLMSISADTNIPVISASQDIFLQKSYGTGAVFALKAPDKATEFTAKFENPMLVQLFTPESVSDGVQETSVLNVTIPANETRYVYIRPRETSIADTFTVKITATESNAWDVSKTITEPGTYIMPLANQRVRYKVSPSVAGTYEWTYAEDAWGSTSLLSIDNVECNNNLKNVCKMEAGKVYEFETYCNANAASMSITLNKINAVEKIEILDKTITQTCFTEMLGGVEDIWREDIFMFNLNVPLKVTFDDGTSKEIRTTDGSAAIEGYGDISSELFDEQGNPVPYNWKEPGKYKIQFYWTKNGDVVSETTIPCFYQSIKAQQWPKLNKEQRVEVPRNHKNMYIAEIDTNAIVSGQATTYRVDTTFNNFGSAFDYGIFKLENGTVTKVSNGKTFVAEPGNTYYLLAKMDDYTIEKIDFSLTEITRTVESLKPEDPELGEKLFFKEFNQELRRGDFFDYKFIVTYSDGTTEKVDVYNDCDDYGQLNCDITYSNEDKTEGTARFYLEDDQDKELADHYYELPIKHVSVEKAPEGSIKEITADMIGQQTELEPYRDKNVCFSFTAPEDGYYDLHWYGHMANLTYYYYDGEKVTPDRGAFSLEAGKTIYGESVINQNAKPEIKVTKVTEENLKPLISSITLKEDDLTTKKVPAWTWNINNEASFDGLTLEVEYANGEKEELVYGAFMKYSKYYGVPRAYFTSESYETRLGKKTVTFGLSDDKTNTRSNQYTFEVVDETKETYPIKTEEGTYKLEYNYGDFACIVFKPAVADNYYFQVDGGTGDVDWVNMEKIYTYPLNYESAWNDPEGFPEGFAPGKTWTQNLKVGDEVCIVISQRDKDTTLKIERTGEFKRIELANLPGKFLKEFYPNFGERLIAKLHFTEGVKEEYLCYYKDSRFFGQMNVVESWNELTPPVGEDGTVTAYFQEEVNKRVTYDVKVYSVFDKNLPITNITKLGQDYRIGENYGFRNVYSFTAPDDGNYILEVKNAAGQKVSADRYFVSSGKTLQTSRDTDTPIQMKKGETIYVADSYNGEDLLINVKTGNIIQSIELIEGKDDLSDTYVWELLNEWDAEREAQYFKNCKFKITYSGGTSDKIGYGDAPSAAGYGNLYMGWPYNNDEDSIIEGNNEVAAPAYFKIPGCTNEVNTMCSIDVHILRADALGLAAIDETGKLTFNPNAKDPGNAKAFEYEAKQKAVYEIKFTSDEAQEQAYMPAAFAAVDTGAESDNYADIQVGEKTWHISGLGAESTVYAEANADQKIFGYYYGNESGVVIKPLVGDALGKIVVDSTTSKSVLYGDSKYAFKGWKFTLNSEELDYAGNKLIGALKFVRTDIDEDEAEKKGIGVGNTLGNVRGSFVPTRVSSFASEITDVNVVKANDSSLNLNKITLGNKYSFDSGSSLYDGHQTAYIDITTAGYYKYNLTWNGTSGSLNVVNNGNCGTFFEKASDVVYLEAGEYAFINRDGNNRDGNVTSITLAENTVSYDALNACIEEGEALDSADYTEETWAAFNEVLNRAIAMNGSQMVTQDAIDAMTEELEAAINALTENPVTPPTDPTPVPPTPVPPTPVPPTPTPVPPTPTPVPPTPSPTPTPSVPDENGTIVEEDGTVIMEDGTTISKGEGEKAPSYDSETGKTTIEEGNEVILSSGDKVTPPAGSVVEKDGSVTEPDGTVIKPDGTVHNTDGSVQKLNGDYISPSTPMLESAAVYSTGNQVKALLSGECNAAEGYDYVISKNINCTKDKDYYQVSKNQLLTNTVFRYIQKGTYYVYCHAWKKDENGIKKFSPWSNYRIVKVFSVTPQTPKIDSVKVRGNKVYVTYTKCKNATGYDIVLGSQRKKVLGEYRPVEYGKYVKKVGKNTYTAVFTGVKKGTYYAGLHSYNRTSEDGKKVFSPWSGCKTVKVK